MNREDIVSADGFRVVASAGPPRQPLPPYTHRVEISSRSRWFPRRYDCGHRGARRFSLHVFGENVDPLRQKELCPECFVAWVKQYTIHCALCGLPIYPGAPVALYNDSQKMLSCATEHSEGVVVGCLRFDCCPSAGFFAGHWSEEGFVSTFGSSEALVTDDE